jgi:hypothetical protein
MWKTTTFQSKTSSVIKHNKPEAMGKNKSTKSDRFSVR